MSTWTKQKLRDVANIRGGKRLPSGHALTNKINTHPYIRARDIGGGKITSYEPVFISENTFSIIKNYAVNEGDVCVTIVGANVGDIGIVPKYLDGANLTENAVRIYPKNNKLNNKFLKYCLIQDDVKIQMKQLAGSGAAQPKLGLYKINSLEIPNPSIENQARIASVLSAYDDLIENNEKRIKILEEMAGRLYREWFVKFQFPRSTSSGQAGHEKVRLIDSGTKYGKIPERWEVTNLSDCIDFQGGSQPPKSQHIYELKDGYIRFIQNRDYSSSSHFTFIRISSRNKVCENLDIMIDKYGEAGAVRYGLAGAYNVALSKLVPLRKNFREYLRSFLSQQVVRDQLANASMASTRSSLNRDTFRNIKIMIPGPEVIEIYERTIKKIRESILATKRRIDNLSKTRDLLIPQLVTGRRAVKN